jgi:hypothetical protein
MRVGSSVAALLTASVALLPMPLACGSFEGADSTPVTPDGGPDGVTSEAGAPDGAVVPTADGGDAGGAKPTVTLASGFALLSGIAADESNVYFVEQSTGGVHGVPLEGGAPVILAPGGGAPLGLTVSAGELFWTDANPISVNRVATSGGIVKTTPAVGGKPSRGIAASPGGVVVLTDNGSSQGDVQQYSRDLVAGPVVANVGTPFDVAIVGADLYWAESSARTIAKGALGNNGRVVVASNEPDGESLAADALGVYWARPVTHDVRALLTGAGFVTLSATEDFASSVASDAASVYWLTTTKGVRRYDRARKTVETIATGFVPIEKRERRTLALTSKYVVWLTDDGRVLRCEK